MIFPPPLPALRTHSLLCHPVGHCSAVHSVTAGAALTESGELALSYRLTGDPLGIRLPAPAVAAQADGLWQHTCCEAFIAAVDCPEYREFNFSPSRQWAAYRFTDYRQRDSSFIPESVPHISFRRLDDGFELDAVLGSELLPAGDTLQLGLSVVLEAANGDKSYWALAHCSPQPDFHLRHSFTLTLNVKRT